MSAGAPYACNNKLRPVIGATVTVQDGWVASGLQTGTDEGRVRTRLPRMIKITQPFSRECKYDRAATDTRCSGCVWLEKPRETNE